MANHCYFEMKIVGKKENVLKMYKYLKADYCYNINGPLKYCTEDKHFFRVFNACSDNLGEYYDNKDNCYLQVYGNCAWSVYSCMMSGPGTYCDNYSHIKDAKFTSLDKVSKELNLDIEVISEEPGCEFMEHFLIKQGEILIDECIDFREEYDEDTDEYERIGGMEYSFSI